MKLWPDSFEAIRQQTKTVEMRLNDEKRRQLCKGSSIVFTNTATGETLTCLVTDVLTYPDFPTLYRHHTPLSIGYAPGETADPADMLRYYTPQEIAQYGVLAICLSLVPESANTVESEHP